MGIGSCDPDFSSQFHLHILLQLNKKISVAQRAKGAKPLQKGEKSSVLLAVECPIVSPEVNRYLLLRLSGRMLSLTEVGVDFWSAGSCLTCLRYSYVFASCPAGVTESKAGLHVHMPCVVEVDNHSLQHAVWFWAHALLFVLRTLCSPFFAEISPPPKCLISVLAKGLITWHRPVEPKLQMLGLF